MAWRNGADVYALYNSLDATYRPLTDRVECPACYTAKARPEPCTLCQWRGYVEIPREQPGKAKLPPHPRRLRAFLYGASIALREEDAKTAGGRVQRRARRE